MNLQKLKDEGFQNKAIDRSTVTKVETIENNIFYVLLYLIDIFYSKFRE